jgi:hypothetical protein
MLARLMKFNVNASRRTMLLVVLMSSMAARFSPGQETVDQPSIRFSEHLIADNYAYAYGIAAADFDQDGDLDLSSADYTPHNKIYLFENDGSGVFRKHTVQENDPTRLERHLAGDVDSDGDLDIVIVKNLDGHLLWFENDGSPTDGSLWKRHVITTSLPGAYDVALADFNKDGTLDVAASSWLLGNQFAWFENDVDPARDRWKKHLIEKDIRETRTMRAADFDGDGDADLLGTIRGIDETVWYENETTGDDIVWSKHIVDDQSNCPAHGNPVDMDGDGDLDIVMALGFRYLPKSKDPTDSKSPEDSQIVWYENENPAGGAWKRHVVQEKFADAFEATAADLDGDGDIDVVATSWRNPGRVSWFENGGDPRGRWKRHSLKENWPSANQVIVADMNGDGKLDIIACAERGSLEVRWWRNEGPGDSDTP